MTHANEPNRLLIVAILTIHSGADDSLREYETEAARIMAKYGGVIERTMVVEPPAAEERMREVHLLSFPNHDAFARYRADADLSALAGLRLSCIAHTEILFGREGPNYSSPEPLR